MVDEMVKRSLLKAVEKKDRPLEQVDFNSICDGNVELFGEKASAKRKDLQTYFYNLKRRSARNYVKELSRVSIAPSKATQAWEARARRMLSPESTVGGESKNGGNDGGEEAEIVELANIFGKNMIVDPSKSLGKNMTVEFASPPTRQERQVPPCAIKIQTKRDLPPSSQMHPPALYANPSFDFKPQTMSTASVQPTAFGPPTNGPFGPPTNNHGGAGPFSPPTNNHGGPFGRPAEARTPEHSNSMDDSDYSRGNSAFSPAAASTLQYQGHPQGTRHNPILIPIDLTHPERHGRFDIKKNDKRKVNGMVRKTVHIQTAIGAADYGNWTCRMDDSDMNMFGRVVIIQGPSRDSHYFLMRDNALPVNVTSDINDAHAGVDFEVINDPERKTCYWKLVFPPDCVLDNMPLSNDAYHVQKVKNGTSTVIDGITFNVLFVQWEIALRNGARKTLDHNPDDNQTLQSLFG